jgi:hypothetical protein
MFVGWITQWTILVCLLAVSSCIRAIIILFGVACSPEKIYILAKIEAEEHMFFSFNFVKICLKSGVKKLSIIENHWVNVLCPSCRIIMLENTFPKLDVSIFR